MPRQQPTALNEEAKAKRAAAKAARAAAARKAAEDRAARQSATLDDVRVAVRTLAEQLREVRRRKRLRNDLSDHLAGFYEEVDKLAKGKSLLPVTDLVLHEANQSIRDAKAIVSGDAYLDRVKEFVPAGDNPVYPDVVVALRTVRQALDRALPRLETYEEAVEERLQEARTIEVGLFMTIQDGEVPSLPAVRRRVADPGEVDLSWFTRPYGSVSDASVFDADKLDEAGSLDDYFVVQEDSE